MDEMLIVEDLMLLLMDDETGTVAGAGVWPYSLGGAVLAELALRGRVSVDESESGLDGPKVHVVGTDALSDPLLQEALDKLSGKPRGSQTAILRIGSSLWHPVIDRLVDRELITKEKRKRLGFIPTTRLPSVDGRHEAEVRARIRAVLEDGVEPDPRTGVLIALLSATNTLPLLRPSLGWSSQIATRAKEIESGNWGAQAVSVVVARTAAAIAASAAVSISVAVSNN